MKPTLLAGAAAAVLALSACSKNSDEPSETSAPTTSASAHGEAAGDAGASGSASPHGGNPHARGGGGGPGRVTVEDGVADFGSFRAQLPDAWEYSKPSSRMRAAEFTLPAEGDGEAAELVVYYFGQSGAGGVQANIDRWVGQFETESEPAIETEEMAGMSVTTVDVSGRYVAAVRPGAEKTHDQPDYRMFAAIVETPQGPYYFRMLGGADVVASHIDAAGEMLDSMEPAGE